MYCFHKQASKQYFSRRKNPDKKGHDDYSRKQTEQIEPTVTQNDNQSAAFGECKENNYFNTIHVNIQGVVNNIIDLQFFVDKNNINFCCLSEHWLKKTEIGLVNFQNYYRVNYFCKTQYQRSR